MKEKNNHEEVEQFLTNYFAHNKEIAEKSFRVYTGDRDNSCTVEKRYIDIVYVNYWIDKKGNMIYKAHMRNGEAYDVENEDFREDYCPHGVNVINEVRKREYL